MGDDAGSPPATWAQPERETETGAAEVVPLTFVSNEDFLRSGDNLDSIEGVSAAVCGPESGTCQPPLVGSGRMTGGRQQDQPQEGPREDMRGCEEPLIASEKDVSVLHDRISGGCGTSKLTCRVATPDTNDTISIGSSTESCSVRHVTPDDSSVEEGTDTHGVGGATCGQGFGRDSPANPPDDSLDSIQRHAAPEEAPPRHDCNDSPVQRGQRTETEGVRMEVKHASGSIGRYRMAPTRGRFGGRRDKASRKRGGPGFQMVSSSGFPGVSWNRRMGAWLAFYYDSQARRSRTFHPKHFNNDVEQARIAAIEFKISVGDTEPKRQPCRYTFLPGSEDELMTEVGAHDTGARKMYGQQRPPGSLPEDRSPVVAESAPGDSAVFQSTPYQSECKGSGVGGAVPSFSQLHEPICSSTLMFFTGPELNTAQLQSLPSYGDWVHPEAASTLLPWDLGQQLLKDGNSSEKRGQPSTPASGQASTSTESEVHPETNEVTGSKDPGIAGTAQVLSPSADAGTSESHHSIPLAPRESLYRKAAGTDPSSDLSRLLTAESISRPVDQPQHLWINSGVAGERLLASGGNLDLTVLAEGRRGDARKRLRTQCRSARDDVHAPLQAECLMRSGRRGSEEPGTPFFKLASAEMVPRNLTSGSASGVPSLPCDAPYEQLGDPFSLNLLPAYGEWILPIAPPGAAEMCAVEAGGLTETNPC